MKKEDFLYSSEYFEKAIKGLNLTKNLFVSSIIVADEHSGKKKLANLIYPNLTFIDAKTIKNIEKIVDEQTHIVIYNFEYLKTIDFLNFENKNILALANTKPNINLEQNFAFIYEIPPLREREDDLELLIEYFKKTAFDELMIDKSKYYELNLDIKKLDITNNKTLKASIYKQLIYLNIDREDLQNILYDYFIKNLNGDNEYAKNLSIFEVPLIKAGLKKFRSQLKLSSVLGINRNTLRKKIDEHNIK